MSAGTRRMSVIKWIGKEDPSMQALSKITVSNSENRSSVIPSSLSSEETRTRYSCLFCGKSFKWRSHWKSHERTHTGERPYKCEICGKAFARSDGLQCHQALHTSTPTLDLCVLCESQYNRHDTQSNVRKLHAVQSEGQATSDSLQCQVCSRKCYSFSGLMKHMQKHKGGIHFKCEVCNKMFVKKSALEIHSRVHTGVKPYSCHICTKAFTIHGNLKRHLIIHSGEKPYECVKCSQCFNNSSHLKRHIKTKHPDWSEVNNISI